MRTTAQLMRDSVRARPQPLISVVVPCYNEARFLETAIRSVLAQNYPNFECVVVLDASTDGSPAVADRMAAEDTRVRVVRHDTNRGLAASRNTGTKAASGALITYLDADDALLPLSLWHRAFVLRKFENDPSVAGTYCVIRPVSEDWSLAQSTEKPTLPGREGRWVDFVTAKGECPFNAHAPLLHRDLVLKMGGFDESMRHGAEDWDLWYRMMRHGYRFKATDTLGAIYRRKAGSMVRAMPAQHVQASLKLIENAHAPWPKEQTVDGTPYLYDRPLPHYTKSVLQAQRLIAFATLCHLGGNKAGFEEVLSELEEDSYFYLRRSFDLNHVIGRGMQRFYDERGGPESMISKYPEAFNEIQAAVLKRVKGAKRRITRTAAPAPAPASLAHPVPAYHALEENRKFAVSVDKMAALKDIHKGERCFIVGNGPSLNKNDLSLLRDEYSFGVNGIFYKTRDTGFSPTYYIVEDSHVVRDNLEEIKKFEARHKFFPSIYRNLLPETENTSFFMMNRGFYEKTGPNFRVPRFSTDITDKIYCGQSVTYINLQLAYYMGFTEVYLIGVDFSYTIPKSAVVDGLNITSTDDDPNHFHPDYFGKGKKWHDPQLDQVKKNYEFADMVYKWDGRKVYNATIGGELEVFERADYNSLFERGGGVSASGVAP